MRVSITVSENYDIGCQFLDENGDTLSWQNMTEEEQMDAVDTLMFFYSFF